MIRNRPWAPLLIALGLIAVAVFAASVLNRAPEPQAVSTAPLQHQPAPSSAPIDPFHASVQLKAALHRSPLCTSGRVPHLVWHIKYSAEHSFPPTHPGRSGPARCATQ